MINEVKGTPAIVRQVILLIPFCRDLAGVIDLITLIGPSKSQ